MKKILILGGLGFIGSSLANRSLALGKKVTVYDNYYPNSGCNLFNVHSFQKDIEIIKGDITNYKLLLKAKSILRKNHRVYAMVNFKELKNSEDLSKLIKGKNNYLDGIRFAVSQYDIE